MPKLKKTPTKEAKTKKTEEQTTLIICEKPQAAAKIASALSNETERKKTDINKVSYYEFERNGRKFLVGCAVGHLFGIQQKKDPGRVKRNNFPNFDVEWKPNYESKGAEYTKRYFELLKKLSREADGFIVATDFDVEGEVIGWNIIRFICDDKEGEKTKRMKFSSLTKDELKNSYENLLPTIEWGQAYSGETRHYLDWFYGINLSRGLMKALSKTGKFRILSIGRVQGPALKIVVDKELKIKNFKPTPYWQIFLLIRDIKGQRLEVQYPKDLTEKKELLKFKQLKGKKGVANTKIKDEEIKQPIPFDLTTLQTEAYSFCGFSPTQTLRHAQQLYLDGVISYPRTSSQEYPESIGYDKILKNLKKYTQLVKYAVNKTPTKGSKTDPAHPAIYPTGEIKKFSIEGEKKIYELIVKRFISCFSKPAIVENKRVSIYVSGLDFYARGLQIKEKNWMNVYPSRLKEQKIPTIIGEVDVDEIRIEEKQTQPPKRYTPASLVRELEKRNLGTKATRASIIETLYSRGYIKEKSIEATPLGINIVETLDKYSPIILDEKLTRDMEKEMEDIQNSKKDFEKKEQKILNDSKKAIKKIAEDIEKNMDKIGRSIGSANEKLIEKQRQENTLDFKCPVCKKGNLRIMYGKKFKRYFISCDAYPNCRTIFSLPPNGLIKASKIKIKSEDERGENKDETEEKEREREEHKEKLELCKECGFPLIISLRKGKRPWKFCFNPNCPTNKEWMRKREEYKEKVEAEKPQTEKRI